MTAHAPSGSARLACPRRAAFTLQASRRAAFTFQASRHAAFTLIELLVVVAVITVLIAILLPSLGRAKAQAQKAACAANLKQLGTAFLIFASEHDGTLPGINLTYDKTYPDDWKNDWLAGYLPGISHNDLIKGGSSFEQQPVNGTLFPYVNRNLKAYRCPSLPFMKLNSGQGSNGRFDYTAVQHFNGAKVQSIRTTSRYKAGAGVFPIPTPLLLEEKPDAWANKDWTDGSWCCVDEVTYNHLGGTNIASIDGSTTWYTPTTAGNLVAYQVIYTGPSGNDFQPGKSSDNYAWGYFNSR